MRSHLSRMVITDIVRTFTLRMNSAKTPTKKDYASFIEALYKNKN